MLVENGSDFGFRRFGAAAGRSGVSVVLVALLTFGRVGCPAVGGIVALTGTSTWFVENPHRDAKVAGTVTPVVRLAVVGVLGSRALGAIELPSGVASLEGADVLPATTAATSTSARIARGAFRG